MLHIKQGRKMNVVACTIVHTFVSPEDRILPNALAKKRRHLNLFQSVKTHHFISLPLHFYSFCLFLLTHFLRRRAFPLFHCR